MTGLSQFLIYHIFMTPFTENISIIYYTYVTVYLFFIQKFSFSFLTFIDIYKIKRLSKVYLQSYMHTSLREGIDWRKITLIEYRPSVDYSSSTSTL